ncbi:MAG: cytidine deaminase [Ilumatobacteraceae bacterium]|nr:cytidine deaminase [Ilumatobacteraceae bacterium]MBJ7421393.1 cytidine deaminase [Ilumatobacteraceae bacterium]
MCMSAQINWNLLRTTALAVANNAYAPYSKFRVGAAALVDDGRIITGCNVENASYGLTLCAECGIISELARSGGGRLIALCTVGNDQPVTPCGRCRQLLWEHGGANMLLEVNGSPRKLSEMLPVAFPEESNFVNPESKS